MNTTQPRKPRQRRQHERSVKVLLPSIPAASLGFLLVRITQDGEAQEYWVTPQRSDFGLAYRIEKSDGETYDVLLEVEGDTCTCKGHTYGGYCKHVDCLRALHAAGLLPLPDVDPVMPDEADLPHPCGSQFDPDLPEEQPEWAA